MITKSNRRKIETFWKNKCAICEKKDYLEIHHITPKKSGGTDEYDNLILLCARCHAAIHKRTYNAAKMNVNASIDYESAIPILDTYFANKIGTRETKERLNLSQKTHLTECSVYKRYKREHNIENFYNNVDLVNSKRRPNV